MTEEEKKLLEETARLTKENHKMLKGLHRAQMMTSFWGAIKWIAIVAVTIWSWMVLQPYLVQMQKLYSQVQETSNTVNDLKVKAGGALDTTGLQDALNALRMGTQ
jgi:hypothetical protein